MAWSTADIPPQSGRVALVTGANSGLGRATAAALAAAGAHVVMAARNQDTAAAARDAVLTAHPEASLELVRLDLASLASVAAAAGQVLARHDRLDLLVNNAGLMAVPEGRTEDGFETQLGVDHLGHWALTSHLLPVLVRTPGARVVTVTSTAQHMGRPLDPENPHLRGRYGPWRAYGQAKLANRHFAVGVEHQFRREGVDAMSLAAHPGLSHTGLQDRTVAAGGGGVVGRVFQRLAAGTGMPTGRGVLSQLRAATDPAARGDRIYGPLLVNSGPPVPKPMLRPGTERAIAVLWQVSRRETGLDVDVRAALRGRP